ncbi:hypothetical protein YN1_8290 [Nanoarchaeota archaeon]
MYKIFRNSIDNIIKEWNKVNSINELNKYENDKDYAPYWAGIIIGYLIIKSVKEDKLGKFAYNLIKACDIRDLENITLDLATIFPGKYTDLYNKVVGYLTSLEESQKAYNK